MKVAITGGTGFIGRHFADRFDPESVVAKCTSVGKIIMLSFL